jgi:methylmalonyl-CoA epimerase
MPTAFSKNWIIDHVGLAVHDLDQAITFYLELGGSSVILREKVEAQGVELAFIDQGETTLELMSPLRMDSALGRFLDRRGPGLHHICYRVNDIVSELERLSKLGLRLIDQHPRPGAGASLIAFIHPSSCFGSLIELCEKSGS